MARYWYAAGHHLVLADIDEQALIARARELEDSARVMTVVTDITQIDDIDGIDDYLPIKVYAIHYIR